MSRERQINIKTPAQIKIMREAGRINATTTVCINDEMVHGVPHPKRKLKEGDIVSIDCGAIFEGFVADSAFTAGVGEISPKAPKLLEVTEGALFAGIENMR